MKVKSHRLFTCTVMLVLILLGSGSINYSQEKPTEPIDVVSTETKLVSSIYHRKVLKLQYGQDQNRLL
jgi:hypothetical protein